MAVVVVESPAKAKTINKYLGGDFTVLASYGHVRDLPPKDGSVNPDDGFRMTWEVSPQSRTHIKAIADALRRDNRLILATDPDREGEAISWHLQEALRDRKAIGKETRIQRIVFNAITKSAIAEAMRHPRQVDAPLVHAYQARRALDYLVGFNLSPVLWRKLPGARSAGRVQSVCLRLIVEREESIEAFTTREYWSVKALLATPRGETYEARLHSLDGQVLEKFSLADANAAQAAAEAVEKRDLMVQSVEAQPLTRKPFAPFRTSTLQQEASRKLRMSARQTMGTAQKLYEAGHITYMRTDGIDMAPEAISAARQAIHSRYGAAYVPPRPHHYKNKAKNAQEAHECIRPTRMNIGADALAIAEDGQRKLYDLIWKRTIASQMAAARLERTTVRVASADKKVELRASGQVVLFDGFLKIYQEGRDDGPQGHRDGDTATAEAAIDMAADTRLPPIRSGEAAQKRAITPEQHFTQPPPRYTEATLVKRMEELGIGRPSTYAAVMTTIEERGYVRKEKGRLHPDPMGRIVTIFLLNFFRKYVEYEFTADMETMLDEISSGVRGYRDVLSGFWQDFSAAIAQTSPLRVAEVLERLDAALAAQIYPARADGGDPRQCPKCATGRLHLKTSRHNGGFVGCTAYPACNYTRPLGGEGEAASAEERTLGLDNGDTIYLKVGRFGPYVQRGEVAQANPKPPRASLPKGWALEDMNLPKALALLSLPREIGAHPEDGEKIEAGIGRYGPYVRHNKTYASLAAVEDVFTIGMNHAVQYLAQKSAKGVRSGGRSVVLKDLGTHPDGGAIAVMDGRYGPYVKWQKVNATLPKGMAPEAVSAEIALTLIQEKQAKPKRKAPTRRKGA